MKTLLIGGALNKGLIEPNTKFYCEDGEFHIGKRLIKEADTKHKFKNLTVSEILAYSSNIGSTKIALKMGADQVRETLTLFGIGEKTGIDLPGEVRGILHPLPWRDHLTANISFGHGVAATALQVANAYAAIANGGWLKKPFVVKAIRNPDTGEWKTTPTVTLKRALSAEVVSILKLMLIGATSEEATGFNARLPGYQVAGKTGTAQKVDLQNKGYLKDSYLSSFAGFVPANDPKAVIYVMVDNPKKSYYGSQVAAPVFANLAKFVVRHFGLAPVILSQENLLPRAEQQHERSVAAIAATENMTVMPDWTGLTLREVLRRTQGQDVQIKVRGQGTVSQTWPLPGAPVDDKRSLLIYLQ